MIVRRGRVGDLVLALPWFAPFFRSFVPAATWGRGAGVLSVMKHRMRYTLAGLALLTAASLDCWRYHARQALIAEAQVRAIARGR